MQRFGEQNMESRTQEQINTEMQQSEVIRKKKLLSVPRNQFFLAVQYSNVTEEDKYKSVIVQIDMDAEKDKSPLCCFIGIDYVKPGGSGGQGSPVSG